MKPIPKQITINTGDQGKIQQIIDEFFSETVKTIEKKLNIHNEPKSFEIKSGELSYNSLQITDDRITYLTYFGKIVASVFEIRNELNYIQYTFYRDIDVINDIGT